MTAGHRRSEIRGRTPDRPVWRAGAVWLLLPALGWAGLEDDFAARCADRTTIERVYHNHRLGDKPPFEQALPRETLERLVRDDLLRETVLKNAYGVDVTSAMLAAEVQRINTTSRAPGMLAEIKAALGNHPARFANAFAKPFLVERLLRERFENDDLLHAPQRREAERVRAELLQTRSARGHEAHSSESETRNPKSGMDPRPLTPAATNDLVAKLLVLLKQSHSNAVTETTWQLGARPVETNAPTADELEIRNRFGANAQLLSRPHRDGEERKSYFEDLPGELQNVLRVQLRQPGDVSAVIETPSGFLLYLCKAKTAETLSVATLSLPKRSLEQWLAEQHGGGK